VAAAPPGEGPRRRKGEMRPDGGVRLKVDEEPLGVVIPLVPPAVEPRVCAVQKNRRPAMEASELVLVAITFLLVSLLFAVAHHIVQHPWSVGNNPPIPTTVSQSIVLNPAAGESASRTTR
jgi:hypothetical protein